MIQETMAINVVKGFFEQCCPGNGKAVTSIEKDGTPIYISFLINLIFLNQHHSLSAKLKSVS